MAELRSVSTGLGEQCVMSFGTTKMQVLCADKLATHHMVCPCRLIRIYYCPTQRSAVIDLLYDLHTALLPVHAQGSSL